MGLDIQFGRVTYQHEFQEEGFVYEAYCGSTCHPQGTAKGAAQLFADHFTGCKTCAQETKRVKALPPEFTRDGAVKT
ncbi:MAG TPA: hypothetical protein VM286_07165 [Candidatus Thermoplasmatota archaeon]|nr:hypothetical protein [Candidatus Thermoplasmatota archaeon]